MSEKLLIKRGRVLLISLLLFFIFFDIAFSQDIYIVDTMTTCKHKILSPSKGPEIMLFDVPEVIEERYKKRSIIPSNVGPSPEIDNLIKKIAAEEGIDYAFIHAIITIESGFNPDAISSAGACGLMQLMPETAKLMGVCNIFDPEENIRGGVKYFKSLLQRFGSIPLALAAYNAGPEAVSKFGGIPPYAETEEYVKLVTSLYCEK